MFAFIDRTCEKPYNQSVTIDERFDEHYDDNRRKIVAGVVGAEYALME